jgi:hypothetical protein
MPSYSSDTKKGDCDKTSAVGYDCTGKVPLNARLGAANQCAPSYGEVGAKMAADSLPRAVYEGAGCQAPRSPRVGDIVLVDVGRDVNGTRVHPAIVLRVWGPTCINARVMEDGGDEYRLSSLTHKSLVPPPTTYAQARPRYWFHRYEDSLIA